MITSPSIGARLKVNSSAHQTDAQAHLLGLLNERSR